VGSFITAPVVRGAPEPYSDAVALAAAADIYRALIGPVPGAGPVRGVHMLKGVLYGWRDNEQQTQCLMWKATETGWANIALGYEVYFTSGGTDEIVEGDLVVGLTSGAGGFALRVVLESGSWAGGTARGRLIFASLTAALVAGEGLTAFPQATPPTTFPDMATCTGPAEQITLLPGGRYEVENFNFSGSTDTKRMYGCDTVNRGFECDGTVFVPINTGMVDDRPTHMKNSKNMLFFGFGGSNQNSGIGQPYAWTAVTGAAEIGIGDDITGYAEQAGDALVIFARNRSDQLLGTSVADFDKKTLSNKSGAIPYTIQTYGSTLYLDDQGIRSITPTQNFGNFNDDPVSQIVQPIIDLFRRKGVLEMTSVGYSAIRFTPEFTYGDMDVAQHRHQTAEVAGVGGYYDSAIYEQIIYDGRLVNSPEFSIEGSGTSLSLLFYGKSAIDLGHTLQGALIHFTPRRLAR
jgi:hypothetical protein